MKIIGVDPGLSGALSILSDNGTLQIYDMPTKKHKINKKLRTVMDPVELARIIDAEGPIDFAVIEKLWGRPEDGGMRGFTFGDGYGLARMAMYANFITVKYVLPKAWMSAMKVPLTVDKNNERTKEGSLIRARELLPAYKHLFARKKDDGRAESALIALCGLSILSSSGESDA